MSAAFLSLFFLFFFFIQFSFFSGSKKSDLSKEEDKRTLSQFSSAVQQCVADRGLGLTALITDHCKMTLKFPEGTNSTWYNAQFKIFEPLEYHYDICDTHVVGTELQYRNMTAVVF